MVFRFLSFTAIKSTDRNKGKIANQENSGTVGVANRDGLETGAVGVGDAGERETV